MPKRSLELIRVLKLDIDCFVAKSWIQDKADVIRLVCGLHRIRVLRVRQTNTRKGFHLYVSIDPSVKAELANRLQFLLGDDSRRVDRNRARISSGLNEWNKLFEEARANR